MLTIIYSDAGFIIDDHLLGRNRLGGGAARRGDCPNKCVHSHKGVNTDSGRISVLQTL